MDYPQIYAKAANGDLQLRDMDARERRSHWVDEKILFRVMTPFVVAGAFVKMATGTGHQRSFDME